MGPKSHRALDAQTTRMTPYDDQDHVPVPTEKELPSKLAVIERRVHARVNGRRTTGEIARQLGLSVTEVAACLAHLREVGVLVGASSEEVDVAIDLDDDSSEPRR